MTPVRFKVLKYFLTGKRNGTGFKDILLFFFAPSYKSKTARVVERIEQGSPFNKILFKGIGRPLYYPSSFPEKSLEQVVCECFYDDNWHYYEIPETKVRPDDVVVDCGAAEGLFGFLVVERCKQLYLIEPVKKFCDSLTRTFESYPHVTVVPQALSSEEGEAFINESNISSSLSSESTGTPVKVTLLDRLFFDSGVPVSYIKIDLEGYDVEALKGAKELIKANKPRIAVTTYHDPKHAEMITDLLRSLVPEYKILTKGIYQETGSPVMLHAWV